MQCAVPRGVGRPCLRQSSTSSSSAEALPGRPSVGFWREPAWVSSWSRRRLASATAFAAKGRGHGEWPKRARPGLPICSMRGTVEMRAYKRYENGQPVETVWEQPAPDDIPGMGFLHQRVQEVAFAWAKEQGA